MTALTVDAARAARNMLVWEGRLDLLSGRLLYDDLTPALTRDLIGRRDVAQFYVTSWRGRAFTLAEKKSPESGNSRGL